MAKAATRKKRKQVVRKGKNKRRQHTVRKGKNKRRQHTVRKGKNKRRRHTVRKWGGTVPPAKPEKQSLWRRVFSRRKKNKKNVDINAPLTKQQLITYIKAHNVTTEGEKIKLTVDYVNEKVNTYNSGQTGQTGQTGQNEIQWKPLTDWLVLYNEINDSPLDFDVIYDKYLKSLFISGTMTENNLSPLFTKKTKLKQIKNANINLIRLYDNIKTADPSFNFNRRYNEIIKDNIVLHAIITENPALENWLNVFCKLNKKEFDCSRGFDKIVHQYITPFLDTDDIINSIYDNIKKQKMKPPANPIIGYKYKTELSKYLGIKENHTTIKNKYPIPVAIALPQAGTPAAGTQTVPLTAPQTGTPVTQATEKKITTTQPTQVPETQAGTQKVVAPPPTQVPPPKAPQLTGTSAPPPKAPQLTGTSAPPPKAPPLTVTQVPEKAQRIIDNEIPKLKNRIQNFQESN